MAAVPSLGAADFTGTCGRQVPKLRDAVPGTPVPPTDESILGDPPMPLGIHKTLVSLLRSPRGRRQGAEMFRTVFQKVPVKEGEKQAAVGAL
jgi:hypothetical protein